MCTLLIVFISTHSPSGWYKTFIPTILSPSLCTLQGITTALPAATVMVVLFEPSGKKGRVAGSGVVEVGSGVVVGRSMLGAKPQTNGRTVETMTFAKQLY